jgi:hypothetical protein
VDGRPVQLRARELHGLSFEPLWLVGPSCYAADAEVADAPQMKSEPFAIVIFCTSDPEIVDAKTRSKWSRVLKYAAQLKPKGQRLRDFIRSNGGLNECARRCARGWND